MRTFKWLAGFIGIIIVVGTLNSLRVAVAAPAVPGHEGERGYALVMDDGTRIELAVVFGLEEVGTATGSGYFIVQRYLPDNNSDDPLHMWLAVVSGGSTRRETGDISVTDGSGREIQRFNFQQALPVEWTINSNSAGSQAMEMIEFSAEKLTRVR